MLEHSSKGREGGISAASNCDTQGTFSGVFLQPHAMHGAKVLQRKRFLGAVLLSIHPFLLVVQSHWKPPPFTSLGLSPLLHFPFMLRACAAVHPIFQWNRDCLVFSPSAATGECLLSHANHLSISHSLGRFQCRFQVGLQEVASTLMQSTPPSQQPSGLCNVPGFLLPNPLSPALLSYSETRRGGCGGK